MSALLIALVCLVLVAIGVVVRLLTIELGGARVPRRKIVERLVEVEVEKVVYLPAVGGSAGAVTAAAAAAGAASAPSPSAATSTAVLDRPEVVATSTVAAPTSTPDTRPADDRPTADRPTADRPTDDRPTAGRPTAGRPGGPPARRPAPPTRRPPPRPRAAPPVDLSPTGGSRRARMRDVVERGEGVRIGLWRRLRSFVSLIVLVVVLGTGAAGLVGAIILAFAFAIAQALG